MIRIYMSGPKEVTESLIKKGADIQHTNKDGYPAIIYAAKHGKK